MQEDNKLILSTIQKNIVLQNMDYLFYKNKDTHRLKMDCQQLLKVPIWQWIQ